MIIQLDCDSGLVIIKVFKVRVLAVTEFQLLHANQVTLLSISVITEVMILIVFHLMPTLSSRVVLRTHYGMLRIADHTDVSNKTAITAASLVLGTWRFTAASFSLLAADHQHAVLICKGLNLR